MFWDKCTDAMEEATIHTQTRVPPEGSEEDEEEEEEAVRSVPTRTRVPEQ